LVGILSERGIDTLISEPTPEAPIESTRELKSFKRSEEAATTDGFSKAVIELTSTLKQLPALSQKQNQSQPIIIPIYIYYQLIWLLQCQKPGRPKKQTKKFLW